MGNKDRAPKTAKTDTAGGGGRTTCQTWLGTTGWASVTMATTLTTTTTAADTGDEIRFDLRGDISVLLVTIYKVIICATPHHY